MWRHVVVGTKCSWLHGDPRGFRDREHRLHSSGDYKDRPPAGEHAGLFRFNQQRSGEPVDLDVEARVIVCRTFVLKWRSLGYRIIVCSVGERHLHAVIDGPDDYGQLTKAVGKSKQKASHAVRLLLPGSIWAANGGFKPIRGRGHFRNSYKYVRTRQEAGTVVWSHRSDEDWIADESVGAVLMRGKREAPARLFPKPASEGTPEDPGRPASDPALRRTSETGLEEQ